MTSLFTVYCSYEGCRATVRLSARTPTECADLLAGRGWVFPEGEDPDVLSTHGRRHCPAHAFACGDEWQWRDAAPSWRAECLTCGEEYLSDKEACIAWDLDHRCEPDVVVRAIKRTPVRT